MRQSAQRVARVVALVTLRRELNIDGGCNGFGYADVAESIGIRKASIHYYLPTKVDLVHILVARYREEAEAGFVELTRHHPDPVGQLRAYVGFWAECIGDGTNTFCLCALLATQIPLLPEEVARK